MAFFAKIDSSLTTITSSGDSVCCKSGGADSNSTKKNTEQQVSLIVYICMMSRSEKNYNDDTVKSRWQNNILSKYILKREDLLLRELTSIRLTTHFKTCRQPNWNSIIVHSKCSLKKVLIQKFHFNCFKVQAINIPIKRSIIADSRDHDHSVGGELPYLSIKQKKCSESVWEENDILPTEYI